MSIFKSTISDYIAAQLKAREKVVAQLSDDNATAGIGNRDEKFLRYTSGKNAWIRMASFVDYESKYYDTKEKRWKNDGRYSGSQLAKKYVLEGGTLAQNKNLRGGVLGKGAVYGSDLDLIASSGTKADRLYGIRPMPGITSANIINISAYGSLREATVQFYAWDRHQLEELEILFMRPGYTVLLEWGWSEYLKHDPTGINGINSYPNNISIENFTKGIDIFSMNTVNEEIIYNKIDELNKKYLGNYDAMLGFIKNFSWQLMPNGGFQCSTTLISRGEALETIKASANPNVIVGSSNPTNQLQQLISSTSEQKPVLSYFEKIFLNLIGYLNDSEIVAKQGQLNPNNNLNPDGTPKALTEAQAAPIRQNVQDVGKSIFEKVFAMPLKRYDKNSKEGYSGIKGFNIRNEGYFMKPIDGGVNGSAIEYISLDSFVAILNTFFILKAEETNANIVDIILPGETPFLISEDTVSIDPTTCLLLNKNATFVTADDANGFSPEVYYIWQVDDTGKLTTAQAGITPLPSDRSNIGKLGNIYISIQKIIDVYRSLYSDGNGVSVLELLRGIMEAINLALGGINNFKIYTKRNIAQIIDAQYLETKDGVGDKDNKFMFDLVGLKSICRDVKINSRIYSEQSSMISIGAAAGNTNNIGDIYSSTQTAFNLGLSDRIVSKLKYSDTSTSKVIINGKEVETEYGYYYGILENVLSLRNHLKYKVLGVKGINGINTNFKITRVPQENDILNASSLLKTVHYQLNGQDIDFKALIPFELEITLDGIGGFITGQIFRINKNILPKEYHNKNFGFIITKQSHSLQNNDWTTVITTQVCLLNNDDENIYPYRGIPKADLKKILQQIEEQLTTISYLKYALTDYMVAGIRNVLWRGEVGSPLDLDKAKVFSKVLDGVKEFQQNNPIETWLKLYIKIFKENGLYADIGGSGLSFSSLINPNFVSDSKILNSDGTYALKNFPTTVDKLITTPEGSKFDTDYFDRFIFNSDIYTDVISSKPVQEEIKQITTVKQSPNVAESTQPYNANIQYQKLQEEKEKRAQQVSNPPSATKKQFLAGGDTFTYLTNTRINVLTPTEWTTAKQNANINSETDTYTEILNNITGNGILDSFVGSDGFYKFISGLVLTQSFPGVGEFSYIDIDALWLKCYNYIVQIYLQGTNQLFSTQVGDMISYYRTNGTPKPEYLRDTWRTGDVKTSSTITGAPSTISAGVGSSDINLKEDIELIGKSNNGLNIYKFKYKNQDGYYQGVIAQELIGTEFENALIFEDNYYKVDYNKIDVEFKSL